MSFFNWLSTFTSILLLGCICLTPILLIAWYFVKKHQLIFHQFIAISNGWFSIKNVIWPAYLGSKLFYAWHSQNQYEGYTFYYSRTDIFSSYGFAFWLRLLPTVISVFFYLNTAEEVFG